MRSLVRLDELRVIFTLNRLFYANWPFAISPSGIQIKPFTNYAVMRRKSGLQFVLHRVVGAPAACSKALNMPSMVVMIRDDAWYDRSNSSIRVIS
jgi:hypothetical protein